MITEVSSRCPMARDTLLITVRNWEQGLGNSILSSEPLNVFILILPFRGQGDKRHGLLPSKNPLGNPGRTRQEELLAVQVLSQSVTSCLSQSRLLCPPTAWRPFPGSSLLKVATFGVYIALQAFPTCSSLSLPFSLQYPTISFLLRLLVCVLFLSERRLHKRLRVVQMFIATASSHLFLDPAVPAYFLMCLIIESQPLSVTLISLSHTGWAQLYRPEPLLSYCDWRSQSFHVPGPRLRGEVEAFKSPVPLPACDQESDSCCGNGQG